MHFLLVKLNVYTEICSYTTRSMVIIQGYKGGREGGRERERESYESLMLIFNTIYHEN